MIMDERLEFIDANGSTPGAINTGGAGTYLLFDVIDLEVARDIGAGEPLWLVITVDTSLASATGTIQFILASDAQAAIATNGTATVHITTGTFLQAAATAGTVLFAGPIPSEGAVYERYLGILQVTGTAAFTAGKINAFLTHDVGKWKAYADATN